MTLIEVLVALTILGIASVVFLSGAATASKAVIVNQELVTAENLAKSQMESVKNQVYDDTNNPPVYAVDPGLSVPSDYTVSVAAERLDPHGDGTGNDDGLQQVTVTIERSGRAILELVGYKGG